MSRTPKMSDDSKRVLRSNKVPEWVQELLPRQLDSMAAETTAYHEAAYYMSAKADMLLAATALRKAAGEVVTVDELRADNARLKRIKESIEARAVELEHTVEEKNAHLLRLTAGDAVAVHSVD